MSTNFSKDSCGNNDLCGNNVDKIQEGFTPKNCGQNSVRIYAKIMSTNFSKDSCGNNVDKIQ